MKQEIATPVCGPVRNDRQIWEEYFIMNEFQLKYGCNPNQKPSRIYMADGSELPITILNGRPGYINFLDALNSWQLVKELKEATGMACATSFKHVSPTSAAVGKPLPLELKKACFVEDGDGQLAAVVHIQLCRLLIGVAAILQFEFFHDISSSVKIRN